MSKIVYESVEVSNFLSFGQKPSKLQLDKKQVRLILGENHDVGDDGESRNGAGKTTILNAIVFAIYGKGLSDKLKNDEYVNFFNAKRCMVTLTFSKGDTRYTIRRGRKPAILEFEVDGGESLTLDSMSNTDKLITKTIGRTYDVFMVDHFLSP